MLCANVITYLSTVKQKMTSNKFIFPGIAAALLLSPVWAEAVTIDKTIDIAVYQLCNGTGTECASTGPAGNDYYAAETNKIWAQAGISVTFSFKQQLMSDTFYNVDDNTPGHTFDNLYDSVFGTGTAGTNTTSVAMFLINDYGGAYGVGYCGYGGLIMSMKAISEFTCDGALGCTGRVDTLAHELGHNLGLIPETFADYGITGDEGHSTNINSLMASGTERNVPVTMSDIAPSGLGYDYLPQTHIDFARNSTLLTSISPVPEPTSALMFSVGLVVVGAMRRRRQATQQA